MKKLYNIVAQWGFVKKLMEKPLFAKLLSYEIVMYLFFGVLTTALSFLTTWVLGLIMPLNHTLFQIFGKDFTWDIITQAISWIVCVIFAFVTNKFFVFESRDRSVGVVLREFLTFAGGRVMSFLLFEEGLYILLDRVLLSRFLPVNPSKYISKALVAVFVVVFNFIVGKFVSFRKKKISDEETEQV